MKNASFSLPLLAALLLIALIPNHVSAQWSLIGNNILSTDFLGTNNNQDLVFKTNGVQRMRINSNATGAFKVGIGNFTQAELAAAGGNFTIRAADGALSDLISTNVGTGSQIRFFGGSPLRLRHVIWELNNALEVVPDYDPASDAVNIFRVNGRSLVGNGNLATNNFSNARFIVEGSSNAGTPAGTTSGQTGLALMGHLESGTFGDLATGTANNEGNKWIGIGRGTSSSYGLRTQWFGQTLTLNLQNDPGNAGIKDAELQWGGNTNADFNFNFIPNITVNSVTQVMQLRSNGLVQIGDRTNALSSDEDLLGDVLANDLRLRVVGDAITTGRFFAVSDATLKRNIKTITNSQDIIKQLRGTTYEFKIDEFPNAGLKRGNQYGFIAQELQKVMPEAVRKIGGGKLGVDYDMLIPVLTEALKTEMEQREALETVVAEQERRISELENKLNTLSVPADGTTGAGFRLEQNSPNPFSESTTITFSMPDNVANASVNIYDLNGRLIRSYRVSGPSGTVIVDGKEMPNGIYLYDLLVDGRQVSLKKMVLSKS